ncbi:MAG TPA: tetratricopeptide repeat protein [Terriglobia bacterium]|nr:tetratricopeptide repeat protein [Terriglobia bacterium]
MSLATGFKLGPYEIISSLGAGGMGEVYRARDSRLGRDVAIKVLAEDKARDREMLGRFEQEARSASALNHPNIITIYDIGQFAPGEHSVSYIAMEFVDGPSLREIISKGQVTIEQVLEISTQAAQALAAAHDKGIVHRDLKPENIMVTGPSGGRPGLVKILDFGLAKLEVHSLATDPSSADTTARLATRAGAILGTIGYMSPEQSSGKEADFRADQFSLGAILYEMVTGRRAFQKSTSVETLAAIIREEPESISQLNPQVPLPLQWAINRCLAKSADARYPSTHDLARDLAIVRDNLGATDQEPAGARLHNLPIQRTALIGRDQELAAVKQILLRQDVRLLVLTGPGGTGKTRLAVQAAEELADNFRGGVYFIPLGLISDPSLVAPTIAQAIGVRQTAGNPILEELKEHMRRSHRLPTLLVLDNFEQVLSAAPLVAELLKVSSVTKILVTSRSLLHLYAEHEFGVPPLALPDLERLPDPQTLAGNPSVALFLQRAAALKPDFALTPDNVHAVAEICARLDGLPLAIELAAARIKLLSPASMLARLQSRLKLLTGGPRDLPERQQTLRATVDWSYELLQPAEQKLFRRLAVFASGCTLEAAEAVSDAKGDLETDLLNAMESLVDKSLLQQNEQKDGEARFRMLETIREYALDLLASSGEQDAIQRAHAAYCLILADEGAAEMNGENVQTWVNRFDLEQDNFRAALDWLAHSGNSAWGLRLSIALHSYWRKHAHPAEGRARLRTFLDLPQVAGQPSTAAQARKPGTKGGKVRASALIAIAELALEQMDLAFARASLEEAVEIYRELGDLSGVAVTLNSLSVVRRNQGDYAAARSLLLETIQIWQEGGDPVSIAHALSNLADVAREQHDYGGALSLCQESLAIFRRLGDRTGMAWVLNHQGDFLREQGDMIAARALYEQALEIFRELGNRVGSARSLTDLGNLASDEGEYGTAQAMHAEALTLFSQLGETRDVTRLLEHIACAAADQGNWERALRVAGAAAGLRKKFGTPLPNSTKAHLETRLDAARQNLTTGAAATAWMEGTGMTSGKAIEYALDRKQG